MTMTMAEHEHEHEQEQHSSEAPNQPLNVKEQLEATANRIWSSVTMVNKNGPDSPDIEAIKVPGVPVGLFSQRNRAEEMDARRRSSANSPNSLQQVVNAMFSSCTAIGAQCTDEDSGGIRQFKANIALKSGRSGDSKSKLGEPSLGAKDLVASSSSQDKRNPPARQLSPARLNLQETSKNLFKNNHEIAEEAIKHLREQHMRDAAEQKLRNDSTVHDESEVAVDTERDIEYSQRSTTRASTIFSDKSITPQSKEELSRVASQLVPKRDSNKLPKMPSGVTPIRSRQEHSFFPASRPRDPPGTKRKEQRAREKKERIRGVPKEVQKATSPLRIFKKRGKQQLQQQQKDVLNSTPESEGPNWDGTENDESLSSQSWDMENDGISDITQTTVDRMIFAVEQQLKVFPKEAEVLSRIHSDITDPAPNQRGRARSEKETKLKVAPSTEGSDSQDFFPMLDGAVAGFDDYKRVMTPPRGSASQKYLTPPSFTRNVGSSGTRSFFTKTTHSTQTSNFASAWRRDEQHFWDTEVAKEEVVVEKTSGKKKTKNKILSLSPGGKSWSKYNKTRHSGETTATTTTTVTPPSPNDARFPHPDHTNREVSYTDHDRLMDNLILQTDVEMAEI